MVFKRYISLWSSSLPAQEQVDRRAQGGRKQIAVCLVKMESSTYLIEVFLDMLQILDAKAEAETLQSTRA